MTQDIGPTNRTIKPTILKRRTYYQQIAQQHRIERLAQEQERKETIRILKGGGVNTPFAGLKGLLS